MCLSISKDHILYLDVQTPNNVALAPLADFTDVMSGENYVTGQRIFNQSRISVSQNKTEDEPVTNELRNSIIADHKTRNTSQEVGDPLNLCSFMDPRFKKKFSDEESF
jgi:hypothetical protein